MSNIFLFKGIEVVKISERYTSGVSALDNEEVTKENYNPKRRISRGLFITKSGKKINADIYVSIHMNYYTDYKCSGWQTFYQSKSEEKLKTDEYQTKLAWGIYMGLQKYFEKN